jgi:hypothetical protein
MMKAAGRYTIEAWNWKEDPRPYLRAMCPTFELESSVGRLDPKRPDRWLRAFARKHRLRVYDPPSVEGLDIDGYILAKEPLSRREIQQIEADYWGEDFDSVYA